MSDTRSGAGDRVSSEQARRFAWARASRVLGGIALAIAAAPLAGWLLDVPLLTRGHPALPSMKFNTALALALMGGATLAPARARSALHLLALAIGAPSLAGALLDIDLRIDELFVNDPDRSARPGRMAIGTALAITSLSAGVLLDERVRYPRAGAAFAMFAGAIAGVGFLGVLYDAPSLRTLGTHGTMAAHTAVALVLLSFARFAAHPPQILLSQGAAGVLLRRFLPAMVLALVALGALRLVGQTMGLFDTSMGVALMVTASSTALALAVVRVAISLEQAELGAASARAGEESSRSALAMSEARKASVIDSAFDAIVSMDHRGRVLDFNPAAEKLFGHAAADVVGKPMAELLVPERLRAAHTAGVARHLGAAVPPSLDRLVELPALRADGSEVQVDIALTKVRGIEPPIFTAFVRDATARRETERRSERERFFALSLDMVFVSRADRVVQVSPALETILGRRPEELVGAPLFELVHPDDRAKSDEARRALATAGRPVDMVLRCQHADGTYRSLHWRAASEADLVYGLARDVTSEVRVAEALRAALAEREALLLEVHHRVKNNLQVVSSLLRMQMRALPAGAAKEALEESFSRVHSIALVHEILYRGRSYAALPLGEYVGTLVRSLARATGAASRGIEIQLNVGEVELPIERAVPCGLVISELVTNALKHAFPHGRRGTVHVALRRTAGETAGLSAAELEVRDDGVGLPPAEQASRGVGTEIVETLLAQLRGTLTIDRDHGAAFRVRFPID